MSIDPLLLQALAGEGNGEGLSMQDVLLSQLEAKDPTAAMIAKYLTQASAEDSDDDDDALEIDNEFDSSARYNPAEVEAAFEQQANQLEFTEEKLSRLTSIARQLKQKLNDANQEIRTLQDRNDTLAEAVGACYLCWGEDHDCEVCSGRGRPGAFVPIADRFQRYIVPANRRLRQQLTRQRPPARAVPEISQQSAVPEFHQRSEISSPKREDHLFQSPSQEQFSQT